MLADIVVDTVRAWRPVRALDRAGEMPHGFTLGLVERSLGLTGPGPWPDGAACFEAGESETQRVRREKRAQKRAKVSVWVPAPDAPRRAEAGRLDAQGSTAGAWCGGRKRSAAPMRVVMGLWGRGFGVEAIARVGELAGAPVSSSALGRLLKQARDPSDVGWGELGAERAGAVQTPIGELVGELAGEESGGSGQ